MPLLKNLLLDIERSGGACHCRGNQKTAIQIDGKDLYPGLKAYVMTSP